MSDLLAINLLLLHHDAHQFTSNSIDKTHFVCFYLLHQRVPLKKNLAYCYVFWDEICATASKSVSVVLDWSVRVCHRVDSNRNSSWSAALHLDLV